MDNTNIQYWFSPVCGAALAAPSRSDRALDSAARPDASALRSMVRRTARRYASAADEFRISTDSYGPAEVESVAVTPYLGRWEAERIAFG